MPPRKEHHVVAERTVITDRDVATCCIEQDIAQSTALAYRNSPRITIYEVRIESEVAEKSNNRPGERPHTKLRVRNEGGTVR